MVQGLRLHHIDWLARDGFGGNVRDYKALCDAMDAKDAEAVRELNTQIFSKFLPALKDRRTPIEANA